MAETNQQGAKPASQQASNSPVDSRRERYAVAFAQAMLTAKPGATPHSLAKQVMDFTDAFITALDARTAGGGK